MTKEESKAYHKEYYKKYYAAHKDEMLANRKYIKESKSAEEKKMRRLEISARKFAKKAAQADADKRAELQAKADIAKSMAMQLRLEKKSLQYLNKPKSNGAKMEEYKKKLEYLANKKRLEELEQERDKLFEIASNYPSDDNLQRLEYIRREIIKAATRLCLSRYISAAGKQQLEEKYNIRVYNKYVNKYND